MNPTLALGLTLVGLALAGYGVSALVRRHRERRWGSLASIDTTHRPSLRAPRIGLVGRPDEVRRQPDGRLVPIELKSRPSPRGGPSTSHRIQVESYLLLLEESSGRVPRSGVIRYSDGGEWIVPWNASARQEVLDLLHEVREPYDGRATPSPGRCAHCRWRPVCDVRAA